MRSGPCTPGSMNSLFSDFVKEFGRESLEGVRDYVEEMLESFWRINKRNNIENVRKTVQGKNRKQKRVSADEGVRSLR